jgi:hypothetical protein
MLTILGNKHRLCDKVSRREALQIGALGVGGLTLADLLRADAHAGKQNSHKAVIMIYMCGAPSHQDMYDLKMDAPAEIRGEFRPIPTNVPGIEISEHMPRTAAIMDKLVPLRSVVGSPSGSHVFQSAGSHERIRPAVRWAVPRHRPSAIRLARASWLPGNCSRCVSAFRASSQRHGSQRNYHGPSR